VAKRVPSWIPIAVEPTTIMENVSSGFNGINTTWTLEFLLREESKSIFSDRSMTIRE